MKRRNLPILTALTLLLTVTVCSNASWFGHRPPRTSSPRRSEVYDPLNSAGFLRYRQGLPSHWRACLLHR